MCAPLPTSGAHTTTHARMQLVCTHTCCAQQHTTTHTLQSTEKSFWYMGAPTPPHIHSCIRTSIAAPQHAQQRLCTYAACTESLCTLLTTASGGLALFAIFSSCRRVLGLAVGPARSRRLLLLAVFSSSSGDPLLPRCRLPRSEAAGVLAVGALNSWAFQRNKESGRHGLHTAQWSAGHHARIRMHTVMVVYLGAVDTSCDLPQFQWMDNIHAVSRLSWL